MKIKKEEFLKIFRKRGTMNELIISGKNDWRGMWNSFRKAFENESFGPKDLQMLPWNSFLEKSEEDVAKWRANLWLIIYYRERLNKDFQMDLYQSFISFLAEIISKGERSDKKLQEENYWREEWDRILGIIFCSYDNEDEGSNKKHIPESECAEIIKSLSWEELIKRSGTNVFRWSENIKLVLRYGERLDKEVRKKLCGSFLRLLRVAVKFSNKGYSEIIFLEKVL